MLNRKHLLDFLLNKNVSYILVLIIFLAIVPVIITNRYVLHVFILFYIFAALAVSYDLIYGYGGQLNFGIAAFMAIGAYCSALLSLRLNVSPFVALFIAGAFSSLSGLLLGAITLRLKGWAYVAMVTIAFAEIVRAILANWVDVTRGYLSLWGIPPFFPDIKSNYYLILAFFLLTVFISRLIVRSKFGLFFMSIKGDDTAAEVVGVDTTRYKVFAFMLNCFFSGLIGSLYAHYIGVLTPDLSSLGITVQVVAMQIFGGSGSLIGPIIGAFILLTSSEVLRFIGEFRLVLYGFLILITIVFVPSGIYGLLKKIWNR